MGSLYENLQVGFLMKEFIFNFGETLVGFPGWGGEVEYFWAVFSDV